MKFSEKEIVIGVVLFVVIGALLLNLFWANPSKIGFCGDGSCSGKETGKCKLDCNWCGDGSCNTDECNSGCNEDCSISQCENRVCELEKGENCLNTPNDCKCTGGYCNTETAQCNYESCGNGICDVGENSISCPNDCYGEEYQESDNSNLNYPIIFVHGHSMTEGDSSYSLHAFSEFQDELEKDGLYEDRGYILASSEKNNFKEGQWANTQKPLSFRTTYYFGEYSSVTDSVSSDDNYPISEYSKRLSKVVDNILYSTGKDKVIIIAHSMGGLVSREYIKNQEGASKVDKLITIGTPNHGVYDYIAFGCQSFLGDLGIAGRGSGSSPECDGMQYDSEFISLLNSGDETFGDVKYLTISGSCGGNPENDGVVRVSSVNLNGADNSIFSCSGLSYDESTFHSALIHPQEVPKAYEEVINFLSN